MTTLGADVTAREAEVLALVRQHLTNTQIADALFISVRTVETHVAALLRKYQVSDRRSLARLAPIENRLGRHALPVPATPFLGRTVERAELSAELAGHRLVTAVGPGGVGKTRLAINVAAAVGARRRDGVWFVDLVRVTDPSAVVPAVAEAVGVPERLAVSLEAALVVSLAGRDGLLVLDNCEHVLDGVRDCVDLVSTNCPEVTVLATSRTRLMLAYERVYPVPGLSVTADGGDAVALFEARVHETTGDEAPDPRRVAALCRALDGMALAIELAASRYATLGLDGLEAGLHERLRFFTVGSHTAGRHRSLRDTIAWSYDLLAPADQSLLRGVSMFASWFDVDAAHTVAAPALRRAAVADGLARLADHNLLVVDRSQQTRYRPLETIRQYGEERLARSGELTAVQERHSVWCRAALGALSTELDDARGDPFDPVVDDTWCDRFDRVADDARAALTRWTGVTDRVTHAAELATMLAGQLWHRGRLLEAQRRFEQAAGLATLPAEKAGLLRMAAGAADSRYAGVEVLRLLRAASDVALTFGDRGGAAYDLAWVSIFIDRAPGIMAELQSAAEAVEVRAEAAAISDGSARTEAAIVLAAAYGDYEKLTLERSEHVVALAHQARDRALESAALDLLIAVHLKLGDLCAAVRAVSRRDAVVGSLPMTAVNGFEHSDHVQYGSTVLLAAGDLVGAAAYADRLARLPFNREEDHLGLARRMNVDALAGRFDAAIDNGERFRRAWERAGMPVVPNLCTCAYAVAMAHGILGDDTRRAEWVQVTQDLGIDADRLAGETTGYAPTFDAILALHRGDAAAAVNRLAVDPDDSVWFRYGSAQYWPTWYAGVWAESAVLAHRDDAPARIARARPIARDNPVAAAMVERAAALAAGDLATVEQFAAKFETLGCPYQEQRTRALATR